MYVFAVVNGEAESAAVIDVLSGDEADAFARSRAANITDRLIRRGFTPTVWLESPTGRKVPIFHPGDQPWV